jgi:hypothetical protein
VPGRAARDPTTRLPHEQRLVAPRRPRRSTGDPLGPGAGSELPPGERGRKEPGVFDPGDPPETRYRLAPFLTFGAEIELDYTFRRNLDLAARRNDDVSLLAPELSLAWSFDPTPAFQAFLNVALSRELVLAEGVDGAGASDDLVLEIKEAFVWLRHPGGASLQVGRQRFEDERAWLYDEELDAIRLRYQRGDLAVELSVSRDGLVRKDVLSAEPRERGNNYVLLVGYRLLDEVELEGYAIVRDDRDADRRRPLFLGLRSRGEPVEDLDYWLELAFVTGRDGPNRIRGWGVDLGVTYEFQVASKPAVTLGVAFGSGDRNPDDGHDGNFRQTGLHDNQGDFGGAATFKYYGQVLDPELSNLAIFTVGIGIRPRESFSLDLVYPTTCSTVRRRRFAAHASTPSRPAVAGDWVTRSTSSSDSRDSGTGWTPKRWWATSSPGPPSRGRPRAPG